jgi:hypothetical protein
VEEKAENPMVIKPSGFDKRGAQTRWLRFEAKAGESVRIKEFQSLIGDTSTVRK